MKLIADSTIDSLPEGRLNQFRAIVDDAYQNLTMKLSQNGILTTHASALIKSYMSLIAKISVEYGIEGVEVYSPASESSLIAFQADVEGAATYLRLKERLEAAPVQSHVVNVHPRTREWLRSEAERLRSSISELNVDEARKKAFEKRMNDLLSEIDRQQFDFGKVLTAIAAVAGIMAPDIGDLADLPGAAQTVMKMQMIVGYEIIDNDKLARIAAPLELPAVQYKPSDDS